MDNNKLEISKEISMQCKIEKLSHKLSTLILSMAWVIRMAKGIGFIESQDTLEKSLNISILKILHNWRQKQ